MLFLSEMDVVSYLYAHVSLVVAAFQTLAGLGALDSPTSITLLGRQMLHYPLDPTHSRILIASFPLGCTLEIVEILSLLNSGPVWVDRAADRDSTTTARQKFLNRDGDHLTALNVFRAWMEIKQQKGDRGKWCKENHVNDKTMKQALKIRQQLAELVEADEWGLYWRTSCGSETELVLRCLLAGLFMNTAVVQADGTYRQTAGNLVSGDTRPSAYDLSNTTSTSCRLEIFPKKGNKCTDRWICSKLKYILPPC